MTPRDTSSYLALTCRPATMDDVPVLAGMNRHLIKDEQSRNRLSLLELESRLRGWLGGQWQAVLFELDGKPVGYLLFQFRPDEYEPSQATVYVRQFFVQREVRRKGIGRRALARAAERFFPNVSVIQLDVLETNPAGRQFWQAVGFEPYCTTMRRTGPFPKPHIE